LDFRLGRGRGSRGAKSNRDLFDGDKVAQKDSAALTRFVV